jgi:hypothetical protein
VELEGRTRRHANRSGRRIAIAPTPFNKVGETALTLKPAKLSVNVALRGGNHEIYFSEKGKKGLTSLITRVPRYVVSPVDGSRYRCRKECLRQAHQYNCDVVVHDRIECLGQSDKSSHGWNQTDLTADH